LSEIDAQIASLDAIDVAAAASLISAAADVALVVDSEGIIRDVRYGSEELSHEGYGKWVGQRWAETVTVESRSKIEALLRDASATAPRKWRHVNHPSSRGSDVPILYSAIQVGKEGKVVAFGRDLRSVAALQQRLVDAQQSMERDYWRLRHVETRYRLLFQMASESVLIVDAANFKILEANPAAGSLLGETVRRVVGRAIPDCFDAPSTKAVKAMLDRVSAAGKSEDVQARLAHDAKEILVSASLFRQENASLFLVRLASIGGATKADGTPNFVLKVVESATDGFVVTDFDGRVLSANPAFVDLAQLAKEEQVKGESLERWLGRPGVDFNVLVANLRQHGSVRLYATTLRGDHGAVADVEISAVSVPHGERPCLGFTIRDVGRRLAADSRSGRQMPRSVEQLTELVGRASLKDLVRESTDLIERLCIEAALELTHDNRASAAEMLGLSRQSLYVKLRRYGLGDLSSENSD
jgi:transcriptional regulator PpsR